MKKYVMIFGLMIGSAITFAQGKVDSMERASKQADKMKAELALDDVQYQAVKAINEEYADKYFQLRRDSSLSKEERQKQAKILHEEKNAAIQKVLTDEQNAKWLPKQKAQAKKHSAHMKKTRGDHAMRMQKNLSLSDEQTSKIKTIDQEFAAKFRALKKDSTIAKEDSQQRTKQLLEEYRTKAKAILTEDQFKRWEDQKAETKRKRKW